MIAVERRNSKKKKELPPLQNGDHLDQKTFHERYEAMPSHVCAELIGGIVFMSSPQMRRHGRYHVKLTQWLVEYEDATPGVEALVNTTNVLGPKSEPQPDGCILILPENGGQTWLEDGYMCGAPEWIGEISDSTESIDLNSKRRDYEESGVREYMVVAARKQQVFWFIRRRGKYKELSPGSDGIYKSEVLPGLWLDADAFLKHDTIRVLAALRNGLASSDHAAFVTKLAAKKS